MRWTSFRIVKADYAASIWSGVGAREFGGRWNSKGVAVIYTAQNRSLAAMEQLVHLVSPRLLRGYVIAGIEFDDADLRRIELGSLDAGWNDPVARPELRKYGDDWIRSSDSLALAVPSAVIPGEWNYLINPAHPRFGAATKSAPEPFVFDHRLG